MRSAATGEFIGAIDRALSEIDRASGRKMRLADGTSAQPRLDTLRDDLLDRRKLALAGSLPTRDTVIALLRWVFDWIPEMDAPLVKVVARIPDTLP